MPISVSQLALARAAPGAIAPERALDRHARPADLDSETEIEFLARRGVPEGVLLCRCAPRCSTTARRRCRRCSRLASASNAIGRCSPTISASRSSTIFPARSWKPIQDCWRSKPVRRAASVLVRLKGRPLLVTAPSRDELRLLRRRLHSTPELRSRIAIATPETIRAFNVARRHRALARYALSRLAGVLPRLSSGQQYAKGMRGPMALVAATLAILLLAPLTTIFAMMVLSSLFFVNCSFWKLATAFRRLRPLKLEPLSDRQLPTYAVLVPLYREAAVVHDLVVASRTARLSQDEAANPASDRGRRSRDARCWRTCHRARTSKSSLFPPAARARSRRR